MTDDNLLYVAIADTGTLTDDQWTSIENWILKTEGTPDPFTEAQVQYQNQVSLVKPGETTLMKAIRQNAPLTVIQALLKIGDKDLLNKRDGAGNTALMKAIERGASPVVIHALLNIGGKELLNMRNTTNGSNKNALDLAYERGPSAATLFENLAAVYVYMQILHVTDIKTVEQTFQAKFYLKASWVQKRTDLFSPDPDKPVIPANWDPDHHPWPIGVRKPNLGFDNSIGEIELTSQSLGISDWRYVPPPPATVPDHRKVGEPFSYPKRPENDTSPLVVVEWKARGAGTFTHPFDLYDYPDDKQQLKITMSSLNQGTFVYDDKYNDVKSTIRKDYVIDQGFQFETNSDLEEGVVGDKLKSEENFVVINQRTRRPFSTLSYMIPIQRSSGIYRELIIPIALITLGSFASFVFPAEDVDKRLAVSITIFLVMTAYSYLKSSYLPKINKYTDVTTYIFLSFVLVFAVVAENAVMSVILCKGWCKADKDFTHEKKIIHADKWVSIVLFAVWFYVNLGLFLSKTKCFSTKCSKCSPFCITRD